MNKDFQNNFQGQRSRSYLCHQKPTASSGQHVTYYCYAVSIFTVVYLVNARAHGQKITHTDISLPKQYSVSPFRARPRYTLNKPETKTQFKTSFICQQLFQQWRSQGEWEFEPPSPSGICLNLLLGRLRHGQF